MKAEPVAILGFVVTAMSLLVAFGVHLTDAQQTAIVKLIAAAIPFIAAIGAWWARSHVTPNSKILVSSSKDEEVIK